MNKEKEETLLENYQTLSELYSNVRKELERTRKALKIAVDALKEYEDGDCYDCYGNWCGCKYSTAHDALEQITALEQGDEK